MKLGLTLPSFVDDPVIPIAVARAAEAAGLDGVFVYDHVWRGDPPARRPALECFSLLGAVAAETTRVHVGTLVARATLRPAATLAHCFETANRVSGGRVIAAIGAGDSQSREENESFGLDFGTLADRVGAMHAAVRATRERGVPVWVSGHSRLVREMTAIADGWNHWGGTPEQFGARAATVRAINPDAVLTWGGLVLLGRDDDAARQKAAGRPIGDNVIVGGPQHVADRLRPYAQLGAQWIIAGPIDASDPDNAPLLAEVRSRL
ncbi:MAG: LLM class flavin-dependent oxidoreductase [Actinomycetota bacterium]